MNKKYENLSRRCERFFFWWLEIWMDKLSVRNNDNEDRFPVIMCLYAERSVRLYIQHGRCCVGRLPASNERWIISIDIIFGSFCWNVERTTGKIMLWFNFVYSLHFTVKGRIHKYSSIQQNNGPKVSTGQCHYINTIVQLHHSVDKQMSQMLNFSLPHSRGKSG